MAIDVTFTDDPSRVLGEAGEFVAGDPVRNSVMLRLLHDRVARPEPGRYWIAKDGPGVCGIVFQSPLTYPALLTPMSDLAAETIVEKITAAGIQLPGVGFHVAASSAFAGWWAARTKSAVWPTAAGRLYECKKKVVSPARPTWGHARLCRPGERKLAIGWIRAFQEEGNALPGDLSPMLDSAIADGRLWLWEDASGPVSMAIKTAAIGGVVAINAVYTPPESRGRGYASACVAKLTARTLREGSRCTLFTSLKNPISNSIYLRIGFRPVQETLRYEFASE